VSSACSRTGCSVCTTDGRARGREARAQSLSVFVVLVALLVLVALVGVAGFAFWDYLNALLTERD
jgi:nitrate reductase NapE component